MRRRALSAFAESALHSERDRTAARLAALRSELPRLEARLIEIDRELDEGRPNEVSDFVSDAMHEQQALRHKVTISTEIQPVWSWGEGRMVTRALPTADTEARGERSLGLIEAIREVEQLSPGLPATLARIEELRQQYGVRRWEIPR